MIITRNGTTKKSSLRVQIFFRSYINKPATAMTQSLLLCYHKHVTMQCMRKFTQNVVATLTRWGDIFVLVLLPQTSNVPPGRALHELLRDLTLTGSLVAAGSTPEMTTSPSESSDSIVMGFNERTFVIHRSSLILSAETERVNVYCEFPATNSQDNVKITSVGSRLFEKNHNFNFCEITSINSRVSWK